MHVLKIYEQTNKGFKSYLLIRLIISISDVGCIFHTCPPTDPTTKIDVVIV